jgi:hypothetical protein
MKIKAHDFPIKGMAEIYIYIYIYIYLSIYIYAYI